MTCPECRDLFSARVDGALGPAESAALDAHLAGCAECRREAAGFERAVGLVRAIEPARAPAGFVDRVLAGARPAPWPARLARRLFVPWPKVPLEAAALLLVAGLAVMLYLGSSEQQRLARSETSPPVAAQAPVPAAKPGAPAERAAAPPATEAPRAMAERQAPPAVLEGRRAKIDTGDRAQAPASEPARAPTEDKRADLAKDKVTQGKVESSARAELGAAKSQAMPQAPPPPDVTARLRAPDIAAAERALGELAARLGGRQTGRRLDAAGLVVVELAVPREAWVRFVREAAGVGALSVERESAEQPVLAIAITVSN